MRVALLSRGWSGAAMARALRASTCEVVAWFHAGPAAESARCGRAVAASVGGRLPAIVAEAIRHRAPEALLRVGGGEESEDRLWHELRRRLPGVPAIELALADPPDPLASPWLAALLAGHESTRLALRVDGKAAPALEIPIAGLRSLASAMRRAALRAAAALRRGELPPEGASGESSRWPDADPFRLELEWDRPARELTAQVRALAPPSPGAAAKLAGESLAVLGARALRWPGDPAAAPGTWYAGARGPVVRCRRGALRIERARVSGLELTGPELVRLLSPSSRRTRSRRRRGPALASSNRPILFGVPSLGREEERAVVETLRSRWIGTGPRVERFEERFAEAVGARFAVAVSSGTAALHLALLAAGVGPGDEVITTPLTFVATANAIVQLGARPVFVDIDPQTLNLDPERVEAVIGARTRALLPVHFGGAPCDLDRLRSIARRHGLALIEDAAHALGARAADGRPVGAAPSEACFSLYPNKNVTSCEGGVITTDDAARASRYRRLRQHGLEADAWERRRRDEARQGLMVELGFKYNLTDLQAAIGLAQLAKLERFTAIRNEQAERYRAALTGLRAIQTLPPLPAPPARHAYHLFTIRVCGIPRERALAALRERGVHAGIHYHPVHLQPYYRRRFGLGPGRFPHAEEAGAGTLSLPIGPSLREADVRRVIEATRALDRLLPARAPARSAPGAASRLPVSDRVCARRFTTWAAGSPEGQS